MNSIIGYPRIGKQRELKFLTEDYFKNNIDEKKLTAKAAELRKTQWEYIAKKGIDFIPVNDFSFYDNLLDTAFLLNIIPERYRKLKTEMSIYFAMARGYQDRDVDVKALPMKKWFNTNYHYIVPEFDDNTNVKLNGTKPFDEYLEAKETGLHTKPVIIGPFTLLKLSDFKGKKQELDFANAVTSVYAEILKTFGKLECEWIQIDEPFLVTDLSETDKKLFDDIYKDLLGKKSGLKILLQTYFGDIRDIYPEAVNMDFDGIGLDFIEGKRNIVLMENFGFPEGKKLFAGVVNGKNIWRNNYTKTLALLDKLSLYTDKNNIVINTSCSLLHVPYTIEVENLTKEQTSQLSFAHEKLDELAELKALFFSGKSSENVILSKNKELVSKRRNLTDEEVQRRLKKLTERDFYRLPKFYEREKIQKNTLNLPLLPTTTIGSFPQTAEVKSNRASFKKGKIGLDEYKSNIKEKIKSCIEIQDKIGLDVLVHGEFERNDMVEFFGENLEGYLFTSKAWVQSYGTRCVKPPIIWSDIKRIRPITVEYIKYAQAQTDRIVKGMLTGPVTILNWSFPREDISNKEMAYQIALAIKDEVIDLEKEGIKIIQVDEAALKEKLPLRREDWHTEYLDWAIPAFRLVHSSVKAETQIHTHMCYSEFTEIVKDIDNMDADVISFEASRSNYVIVEALRKAGFKTQVGPGVYDIHSPRIPAESEITEILKNILYKNKLKAEKLWVNPDCGLKTRGEEETIPSLINLVKAAKAVRNEIISS